MASNIKKRVRKVLTIIIISLVILGLVAAYVPLLFV